MARIFELPDGRKLRLWSASNTSSIDLYNDGGSFKIDGPSSNWHFTSGTNLVFEGPTHSITGTNSSITFGASGDTFNFDTTGATYNFRTLNISGSALWGTAGFYSSSSGVLNVSGSLQIDGLTASRIVLTDASKNLTSMASGTSSQYVRGDLTMQTLNTTAVTEGSNLYFTDARVRAVALTGFASTNSSITATDNILAGFGKAEGQISYIRSRMFVTSTAGTADWNDATNCYAGFGTTLLYGNATNGPTSTTGYYYPWNVTYGNISGTSNLTQFAFPYQAVNPQIFLRWRYSSTWSSWAEIYSSLSTLTGYASGANSPIAANDTILSAFGKTQGQIANKQDLDATLTALAGLDTSAGLVYQAGADAFTKVSSGSFALSVHTHPASDITSGTFDNARISISNVSQHQSALVIGWGQLSSIPTTLTGYGITDAQGLDATLTALAGLDSASGYVKQTGADTFTKSSTVPWTDITGAPSDYTPAAHTLDSHSNVTITSNSSGEILKWNGSAWINNTLAEAGISATGHSHAWSDLTSGVPTTLAGYGITDVPWSTLTSVPTSFTPSSHVHAWGDITSGVPTTLAGYGISDAQGLDSTLTALASFNTNGILTQTAADTFVGRSIAGTTNQLTVTNGDGVSGNPTISIPTDFQIGEKLTVTRTAGDSAYAAIIQHTGGTSNRHGLQVSTDGNSSNSVAFNVSTAANSNSVVVDGAGMTGFGLVPSGSHRVQIQGSGNTSSTDALRITNSDTTSIFTVNNAGFVGLGSTSATSKLTVGNSGTDVAVAGGQFSATPTHNTTTARSHYGFLSYVNSTYNDTSATNQYGGWFSLSNSSVASGKTISGVVAGIYSDCKVVTSAHSGIFSSIYSGYFIHGASSAATGSGTVTNSYGVRVVTDFATPTSFTISNSYGLFLGGSGSTSYPTLNYGIYEGYTAASNTINYFASPIQIGTTTKGANFNITRNNSGAAWGSNGICSRIGSGTYTDTSTASGATVTQNVVHTFFAPTLAATNASVTYTNAYNIYVAGAPAAGTNAIITNPWSLYVIGQTRLANTWIGGSPSAAQPNTNMLAGSGFGGVQIKSTGVTTLPTLEFFVDSNSVTDGMSTGKIGFWAGTTTARENARIEALAVSVSENAASLVFSTATGGTLTERMRILSTGTINVTGFTAAGNKVVLADATGNLSALTVGTSAQFLRGDGTWQTPAGTGTVTSVALSLPAQFSVTGSPVTSSGTLTAAWANQASSLVFAGPVSGASAVPAFRALVAGDIPTLTASKISDFDATVRACTLTGFASSNSVVVAGDTVLQGIGKLQGQISAKKERRTLVFFSAYTPTVSGADDVQIPIPRLADAGTNWTPKKLRVRVNTASAGTTTVRCEYYNGTGAFSATNIHTGGDVSLSGGSTYEASTTTFSTTTLASDAWLRINFTALDATHAKFTVYLEIEEQ